MEYKKNLFHVENVSTEKLAKKFDTVTIRADDPNASEIIKSQTGNKGVDLVIIATGNLKALLDAFKLV